MGKEPKYIIVKRQDWLEMTKEIERIHRREKRAINKPAIAAMTNDDIKSIFSFCLESTKRNPDIVEKRHFSRYFLCTNTKYTLKKIGVLTNCKDHSTVIHSRDRTHFNINKYPDTYNAYAVFEDEIMAKIEAIYNEQTQQPKQIVSEWQPSQELEMETAN